jgi:hypothetical protein
LQTYLQILYQDVSQSLQNASSELSTGLPLILRDISYVTKEAVELKEGLQEIVQDSALSVDDENVKAVRALSSIDKAKRRVDNCFTTMKGERLVLR